ncbi:MAG: hypothetical protein HOP19_24485 [Acidobacteria bacterium]|nr:hypothetical protein [Acidobacteriota bacterium]
MNPYKSCKPWQARISCNWTRKTISWVCAFIAVASLAYPARRASAQPPQVAAVSAASYALNGALAADSIGALFGSNMAGGVAFAGTHPLPLQLASVSVNVRDATNTLRPAPLFFVSPQQINFIVPNGTVNGNATITVMRDGVIAGQGTLTIDSIATGLFGYNGNGQGVAVAEVLRLRSDGSLSYEPLARFNPATNSFEGIPIALAPNEQAALVLYGTGFRNNTSLNAAACTIGGENAQVFFTGAQPSLAGLDQANVRLSPSLAGRGIVNVVLSVAGKTSNTVTITMQ